MALLSSENRVAGRRGFTLIEMMVVAAIIVALLAVTMPTIRSIMRSGELAQTENTVRAALTAARSYAVQKRIITGARFLDDGHIVLVYARNYLECQAANNPNNYRQRPTNGTVLDMKAIEDRPPDMMSGPYRVTYGDVGAYSYGYTAIGSWMQTNWVGPTNAYDTASRYDQAWYGPNEWMDAANTWFAQPVVLFDPNGLVCWWDCMFRGDSNPLFTGDPGPPGVLSGYWAWYPTMAGSFIKATARAGVPNNNPIANGSTGLHTGPQPFVRYNNQIAISGWHCDDPPNCYKAAQIGANSHWIPVEGPSLTARPRIFNYADVRGVIGSSPVDLTNAATRAVMNTACGVIADSATDLMIESETGMVVRARNQDKTGNN